MGWADEVIKDYVAKELPKAIDKVLGPILQNEIKVFLKKKPDTTLSRVGFDWALYFALNEIWSDVPPKEAVRWLKEYIDTPYGTKGYGWSYNDARLIAKEYTNEFGEIH